MSAFLKAAFAFFKTWFLPQPAHDDIVHAKPQQSGIDESLAETETETEDARNNTIADSKIPDDDLPSQNPVTAPPPKRRSRKNYAIDASKFAHLVAPPEGHENRIDRRRRKTESADPIESADSTISEPADNATETE